MQRPLLFLFALSTVALAACGSPAASGQTATPASIEQGKELYTVNCGACHGADGRGSDQAPTVFGHTAEQVREQVRDPMGEMIAFPADRLSDEDLALIVDYITSVEAEAAHPDIEPTDQEREHLMIAYEAIQDYKNMDRQTAIDHLNQAIALASGESAEVYQELLDEIEAGRAGNARHELAELLGIEEEMR